MTKGPTLRLWNLALIGVLGIFALAACSTSTPAASATQPPAPLAATAIPTQIAPTTIPSTAIPPTQIPPTSTPVVASGIEGGDPEFDFSVMVSQGYWLSRDHFGPFVMASGMGIPSQPPTDLVQMAIQMVAQNPDDPAKVPQNMVPSQAVFASSAPSLANDPREYDALDFEGLRLDPSTFDDTVTVRGQAYTMLTESQWAHTFASGHFGAPSDDFGAQQRFMGMMVSMLAQMQGQYAMQNLMGEDGLYRDSDGTLDYLENWVMLHAFSDIAGLTGEEGGRYMTPDSHPMFEGAATQLFLMLESRQPESPQEAAAAIRSLVYRASTTEDSEVGAAALARAKAIADATLVGLATDDVVQMAAAIAGLLAAGEIDGDGSYGEAANGLYQTLADDFNPVNGVFNSKTVYTADEVAWIIGGLNALAQKGNDISKFPAEDLLLAFYESAVSLSGIQLSAPPGKDGAMVGEWEKDLPSALYYHPANTPPPPMANALPVPAEEITWDGGAWSVTSDRFVPSTAMNLANELNWLGPHFGSIPFPPLGK